MGLEEVATLFSGALVVGFCVCLIGLAVVIFARPSAAEQFLMSFASSARTHYAEQALRLLVGSAIVNCAGSMWYPELFRIFGWLVVGTTIGLLLIPWQWHHKLATLVMPSVIRRMRLFALAAAGLGGFILYSLSRVMTR